MATTLAEKMHLKVYVLRVIKTHGGAYFDHEGEIVEDHAHDISKYKEIKEKESKKLQDWVNKINPNAYTVIKYGGVADTILDTINKYKVGLVILGNRFTENEGFRFFGDLTSHLIRKSKVPVLSLKKYPENGRLQHIVLANEFEGKISFYDALQDMYHHCNAVVDMLYISKSDKIEKERIYANMDNFAHLNTIKNYTKNIYRANDIEAGILEWIGEHPCDLLAMKNISYGRKGLALFKAKAKLSKRILNKANVSILIYND